MLIIRILMDIMFGIVFLEILILMRNSMSVEKL